MKIPSIEQIRTLDALTIQNEPVSSADLMERAARSCFQWIEHHIPREKPFLVFCGTGNNGGDGLVIARLLAQKKRPVRVVIVRYSEEGSADFNLNLTRLRQNPKIEITEFRESDPLPLIPEGCVIIDAVFGSGLTRPVTGFVADLLSAVNRSKAGKRIAIDIPSGLFAEDNSHNEGTVFRAQVTLTFQFPKLAFFFAENAPFVGHWMVLPIGLHPASIGTTPVKKYWLEAEDIIPLIRPRETFAHKGTFGHALLIAGSYGKTGAAVLGARAALRAGTGLLTVHIPECGYNILQTAVPEAMVSVDKEKECYSVNPSVGSYQAIAVGPGIGTSERSQKALKVLIQESGLPVIYDADALNILGENKTWLSFLTADSILTPHPKEFERLTGKSANSHERLQKQVDFSLKHGVYVVLKGAFTCISCPDGTVYFNSTGNPGMATAGSGDVLTGILLGLKAQGYSSLHTCLLGTYLHGLAGDIAADRRSQTAMTAGDIIEFLGKAWKYLKAY